MKIILAELEKRLFPENFPYFENHFLEDKEFLKYNECYDEKSFQNIAFKLKIIRLSLEIKNQQLRQALSFLFETQVDLYYNWEQSYDWYELKSILCFFMLFSNLKTFKELENQTKKPNIKQLINKYLPKPD